jgi:hypothetical protein
MKYFEVALFLTVLFLVGAAHGQNRPVYKTYYNPRFEFSVAYPSNILIPEPPAWNGDGRIFRSADGAIEMRAYGGYNALFQTLSEVYKKECAVRGREITYKAFNGNWFVVSGYEGQNVFYLKQILKKDALKNEIFLTFTIEYPKSRKNILDPVIAKVAKSFK